MPSPEKWRSNLLYNLLGGDVAEWLIMTAHIEGQPRVYRDDYCWYGDPNPARGHKQQQHLGICNQPGQLYRVGKPMGLGTCNIYLCANHAIILRTMKFTVDKVPNV